MTFKNQKKLIKIKEQVNTRLISSFAIFRNCNSKVLFATLCLLAIVVLGAITGGFGSFGSIVRADSVKGIGVGIYWDQTCSNRTLTFQWGQLDPGANKTLTIYVKNECNSPIVLSLETSNWTPSASAHYISLAWNYSSQVINANDVVPIEITLTINSTINGISDFNYNTIIAASEH